MSVTISQKDYWDLIHQTRCQQNLNHNDKFDVTYQYPEQLGQGILREIKPKQGVRLTIVDYRLHDNVNVILQLPERSHSLEYLFRIAEKPVSTLMPSGKYVLHGSGMAPIERDEKLAAEVVKLINIHIEPEVFRGFLGDYELSSVKLGHLTRPSDRCYYTCRGTTTVAMQTVLHQILHCPFQDITKKVYLESKVWELTALLIGEERERHQSKRSASNLKPDDIDRIHHAREILSNSLDNPPCLSELARQIGSNEYTLKRGFREVFDTTAFGYLYEQRMEYARQLLLTREFNVAQVATKVGYASQGRFAIAFRKKFGVNPKVFLKEHRE